MRIAQITDIHVSHEEERPHGVDTRGHFLKVLEEVMEREPDHLVISGDLCYREAVEDIYAWIAEQLSRVKCTVTVLAGNHDSQKVMQDHFRTAYYQDTDEIYTLETLDGMPVFMLDTARGVMSEAQYAWLESHLPGVEEPVVFFMHHPPLYCGVPHMDEQYAFQEIPRIQAMLQSRTGPVYVFCGHYHVERTLRVHNQHVHITPSTFFQIDATQREFGIDHRLPGYRMIEIVSGGVESSCFYVSA